jgi:hypothetical protein
MSNQNPLNHHFPYPKSLKTRSSRMRNVNAKTSNLLSLGTNNVRNYNKELTSKADRNGYGFAYHRSDCSYPYVKLYTWGGDSVGSDCGGWVASSPTMIGVVIDDNGDWLQNGHIRIQLSDADLVWYGVYDSGYALDRTASNKYYKRPQNNHNWTIGEILNMRGNTVMEQWFPNGYPLT